MQEKEMIARAETRGKRYSIELWMLSSEDFKVEEFTHGQSCGSSCGIKTMKDAVSCFMRKIEEARIYDGINYNIVFFLDKGKVCIVFECKNEASDGGYCDSCQGKMVYRVKP